MERNLSNEIVRSLMRDDLHVRALAQHLNTNHTSVINHLRDLVGLNVLDFRSVGRNKVYFIKNSIEAIEYVKLVEHHVLIDTLRQYPELRQIVKRIQDEGDVPLAALFGSYAKGTATCDSDIDLYVETEDRNVRKRLRRLHGRLSIKIGKFDARSELMQEIIRYHVLIKGVERFHEKTKILE